MKAVFFKSDWPEEFGQEILVTYLRKDESESDAILRAMELYDPKYDFYVKQHFGVEDRAIPILSADEQALFAGIASSKLFTIEGAKKQFGVEE